MAMPIPWGRVVPAFAMDSPPKVLAQAKAVLASTKPKFTKYQVARRIIELKELFARGLLVQSFYERKLKECEVAE